MEEKRKMDATRKGVIVEFDFTALDGASLLYKVTREYLAALDGIAFDRVAEAKYLAGGNYQGGLAEYYTIVKTKKTAAKSAKDLSAAFAKALAGAIPAAVTPGFKNFVNALVEKGVVVVISTRADIEAVKPAFEGILGENVVLHHEASTTYGSVKWDAWRRACIAGGLRPTMTVALTGSGYGVKSALQAGLGSVAVINDHVAYQDFTGVDDVVKELGAPAAKTVLGVLRVS